MKKRGVILVFSFLAFSLITHTICGEKVFSNSEGIDVSITVESDESNVMPNKNVKYKPTIIYKGTSGYIRVKLDISNDFINLNHFIGLPDDWIKKADYLYYTKPMHNNERITLFEGFKIPQHMDDSLMNSKFNIVLKCDAIQADCLNPDFSDEQPWGKDFIINESNFSSNSYNNTDSLPTQFSKIPQTGDDFSFKSFLLFMLSMIACRLLLTKKKRRAMILWEEK